MITIWYLFFFIYQCACAQRYNLMDFGIYKIFKLSILKTIVGQIRICLTVNKSWNGWEEQSIWQQCLWYLQMWCELCDELDVIDMVMDVIAKSFRIYTVNIIIWLIILFVFQFCGCRYMCQMNPSKMECNRFANYISVSIYIYTLVEYSNNTYSKMYKLLCLCCV